MEMGEGTAASEVKIATVAEPEDEVLICVGQVAVFAVWKDRDLDGGKWRTYHW